MKKIILCLGLICLGHTQTESLKTKTTRLTKEAATTLTHVVNAIPKEIAGVADKLMLPVLAYHIGKHSLKSVGCPVSHTTSSKTKLKKVGHGAVTLATGVAIISLVHAALTTEKARTFIAENMPHLHRMLQHLEQEDITVKINRGKKTL